MKLLDRLIKINLYLIVFLTPIFFLPLTIWPLSLNKQMLLAFLTFLGLILWLIKIISSGQFRLNTSKISILVFVLLLVLGISTVFSKSRTQSFWGMNFESDTFFNFLLFGLVFFLFANFRGQTSTEINSILYAFLSSAALLAMLFLIQILLKQPIFPWDFTRPLGFNPIGSVNALGLFLGAGFVLLASLITAEKNAEQNAEKTLKESALNQRINQRKFSVKGILKRIKQIVPIVLGIILFTCILLINYWLIWLGIALAMILIIAQMSKSIGPEFEQKDLKKFLLPSILLALGLVFIFIRIPTERIVFIGPEVNLTQKASWDIGVQSLRESIKNLVFGSGPATFEYQYLLYKPNSINLTGAWQLRFNQGISVLLTFLAVNGILPFFILLLLIGFFLFQGVKSIYKGRDLTSTESTGQFAVFVPGFYLLLLWFFYPLNFVLGFSAFLMLGLWTSFSVVKKEFSFTQSPQKAFFTMMISVILVVGCVVGIYQISQKYRAALIYSKGLTLTEIDDAIAKINQAVLIDKKDVYFRTLSELFLFKINEVVNNQELEQSKKQELFQQAVANAEMSANAVVEINSKNSQNWLQLGTVYENLALFGTEGAIDLAISNYEKALELNPQNPQIPLNMGRVYKTEMERVKVQLVISEQTEGIDEQEIEQNKQMYAKNFDLSMQNFKKALDLKPNFSAGYYLIAQNYETNDEPEKALENYKIVLQLEPENEEIQKKIEELLAAATAD